jgi:hypothetical protein
MLQALTSLQLSKQLRAMLERLLCPTSPVNSRRRTSSLQRLRRSRLRGSEI